jgi:hypothetical protein
MQDGIDLNVLGVLGTATERGLYHSLCLGTAELCIWWDEVHNDRLNIQLAHLTLFT